MMAMTLQGWLKSTSFSRVIFTYCSADAHDDFKSMNAQVLGMSVDSQFSHLAWIQTPRNEGGVGDLKYPLVSDFKKVGVVFASLGFMHHSENLGNTSCHCELLKMYSILKCCS